jgi:putative glutamine amidotransferase
MKKKIAITQRLLRNESYPEIRDALDVRWAELFAGLGYLPVILPTFFDFSRYFEDMAIEGIILSGGDTPASVSGDRLSLKRDLFEKQLIGFALREDIPVMGVCRGMQIIGEFFHAGLEKVDGHAGSRHKLVVSGESRFSSELRTFGMVNSYHNYTVSSVADDFIVSARSEDGFIEAIEHRRYRIFGQMWHCERETPLCENDLTLIRRFFTQMDGGEQV